MIQRLYSNYWSNRWFRNTILFLITTLVTVGLSIRSAPADPTLNALATEVKGDLERLIGYRFTKPIVVTQANEYQRLFIDTAPPGHKTATAKPVVRDPADPSAWIYIRDRRVADSGGAPPSSWDACLIVIADHWSSLHVSSQRSTMAHEIYHCYQKEKLGALYPLPRWVSEGTAAWAGETYAGGSPMSSNPGTIGVRSWWETYLTVNAQVEDRIYDALGVFSHIANSSDRDVFRFLDRAFSPGDPLPPPAAEAAWIERFVRLMANEDEFLQTWAMGLERHSGSWEWNTDGPGITMHRRSVQPLAIPAGRRITRTDQRLYSFTLPEGEVIHIDVTGGHGGIRWGETTTRISNNFDKRYCLGETCRCEDGSMPAGVISVPESDAVIGLTAYPNSSELHINPIEDPCEEPEEPDTPGTPWGGEGDRASGTSYGDPHIITYDGYRYSFQTVGEFLLTGSINDNFQVQTRQEQVPGRQLSLNTAVAMQVGDNRVAIYAQHAPDGQTPVWIDGIPLPVSQGQMPLSGGGQVRLSDGYYVVVWPTGEQVTISSIRMGGAPFFNISPEVSRQGNYVGLLGNLNGNPDDDLQIQGGGVIPTQNVYAPITRLVNRFITSRIPSPIPLSNVEQAFFQQLYRQFGDSWRIAQANSLFDYGPGQSTETFTNRNFPSQFPSLVGVAPTQIQEATRLCQDAGVNEWFLEGCVFDVAATGQADFVQAAVNAIADVVIDEIQDRIVDEVEAEVRQNIPFPIPLPRLPF